MDRGAVVEQEQRESIAEVDPMAARWRNLFNGSAGVGVPGSLFDKGLNNPGPAPRWDETTTTLDERDVVCEDSVWRSILGTRDSALARTFGLWTWLCGQGNLCVG